MPTENKPVLAATSVQNKQQNHQTNQQQNYKRSKREARESKAAKKLQYTRTKENRQAEIDKIMAKLNELGISKTILGEFNQIASDYIEQGYSSSGKVKIPEIGRELVYALTMDTRHPVLSMLRNID